MCGIVYCKTFKPGKKGVNFKVANLYEKQKTRGRKGFGYYAPETDRFVHHPEETRILSLLKREKGAKEILFHHRNPTSTDNTRNGCHPYSTKPQTGKALDHTYIGVHNGVINNSYALKAEHLKLGIAYVSAEPAPKFRFNDSEALIYELALFIEGKKENFEAAGAMAWILMELGDDGKPVKLHFGRNSNPLKINRKHNKFLTLSSAGPGPDIDADTHYTYDYAANTYTKEPMTMRGYTTQSMGFRGNSPIGPKKYSHTLADPKTIDATRAGESYANGMYDQAGKWHPKVVGAGTVESLPAHATESIGQPENWMGSASTGTTEGDNSEMYRSLLSPFKISELRAVISGKEIEAYINEIMKLAEYEKDQTLALLAAKRAKCRTALAQSRSKLLESGPLVLSQDAFDVLEDTVYTDEIDLYILEHGYDLANAKHEDEYIEAYMASEQSHGQEIFEKENIEQ